MKEHPTRRPLWRLVVPVKRSDLAKSRLLVSPEVRADLHIAMAVDTVVAATEVGGARSVLVATNDKRVAAAVADLGVRVLGVPDLDLNQAIVAGLDWWAEHIEPTTKPTAYAVLMADLPAARGADLGFVLEQAEDFQACFVPDASGNGTTILMGRRPNPQFGPDSAMAHHRSGAIALTAALGLRADVNTLEDLHALAGRGLLGPRTLEVATRHGLIPGGAPA